MIEKENELLSIAFPNTITKHDNVYKHYKIDKWKDNNWKRQEVGPADDYYAYENVRDYGKI